jgi:hypothetical protein
MTQDVIIGKYMRLLILFGILITASHKYFGQELPLIVLNEINSDNPAGPDNAEFIELFGPSNQSLDSLVLVLFEGTDDVSYAAFDLNGFQLDQNGFFVAGSLSVSGVDLILPNGIISNGQDAIALYRGDAEDFPNGISPIPAQLIDAVVYGTNDPSDDGLIAALGLASLSYVQLDETLQTSFPDYSLSRIPDGGDPFDFLRYELQPITPGVFNYLPCQGGNLLFTDQTISANVCQSNLPLPIEIVHLNNSAEALNVYLITNSDDVILDTTSTTVYDLSGYAEGHYRIHGFTYIGALIGYDNTSDISINSLSATFCHALSDNFLEVEITSCNSCDGGIITSTEGLTFAICHNTSHQFVLQHETTSENENYIYFLTNTDQSLISEIEDTTELSTLPEGFYHIYGIAYTGELDAMSVQPGQQVSGITGSSCTDISDNFIELQVFSCQTIVPCDRLIISEYLEGNAGTRALELYNPSVSSMILDDYSILLYTNGNQTALDTLQLSGMLAPLSTWLISNPGTGAGNGLADPVVVELGDIVDFIANFTGNDAIELRYQNTVVDVIGVVGENPGNQTGWLLSGGSTNNVDLRRKSYVQTPTEYWEVSSYQWDVFTAENYSGLSNHFGEACSPILIAGFLDDIKTIDENAGTISIEIQCQNSIGPTEITMTVASGSAEESDYSVDIPISLHFDESTMLLTVSIAIIDDVLPEPDENLILMLSGENISNWTNQYLEILIRQNDENCNGGQLSLVSGNNPIQQCVDLPNPEIDVLVDSIFPAASYLFVITDTSNFIVDTTSANPINLDELGAGFFRVYGISFSGQLISESIALNQHITNVQADTCISISSNFVEVKREACLVTGCNGGTVSTPDGSIFITICELIANTTILPQHSNESVDDSYMFVLTNEEGHIIEVIDDAWHSEDYETGNYKIFGISYIGTIDSLNLVPGLNISGITATECESLSENHIAITITTCPGYDQCSQLFFSEYIEETESNKAIEIYNPTPFPVSMENYSIRMYSNGALTPAAVLNSTNVISPYDVFVVLSPGNGLSDPDPQLSAQSDTTNATADLSGNDAFELMYLDSVIDVIGIVGQNPGQLGWQFGNASTSNQVLVRRPEVTSPANDWAIVSGQWIAYSAQDFTHIGAHQANDCDLSSIPALSFIQTTQQVNESNTTISISLYSFNPGEAFEAAINASGTATNGEDYNLNFPLTLNIPNGTNYLTLEIMIMTDPSIEGTETILLEIENIDNVILGNSYHTIYIDDVTGTSETASLFLRIWPNPANHQLNIFSKKFIHSLVLTDQAGRVIYQLDQTFTGNQTLDMHDIESGIYHLQFYCDSMPFYQRVIVAH